jgi:hypothetical protein
VSDLAREAGIGKGEVGVVLAACLEQVAHARHGRETQGAFLFTWGAPRWLWGVKMGSLSLSSCCIGMPCYIVGIVTSKSYATSDITVRNGIDRT